mgnify:CR=1 FL=1
MPDTKKTEIVAILDRSGSMAGLERDTIGGFNSFLAQQKETEGEALLTTILFDNEFYLLHNRVDIREVLPITAKDYWVRGSTALLDALGDGIRKIIEAQRREKNEMPENTIFMIITDGQENSSYRYSYKDIKRMIKRQQDIYGWEFLFMGANMDAVGAAADIGIRADRAVRYYADREGTNINFRAAARAVDTVRLEKRLSSDWSEDIATYYSRTAGTGSDPDKKNGRSK